MNWRLALRILSSVFLIFFKSDFILSQQILLSREKSIVSDDSQELLGMLGDKVLVFGNQGVRYELDIYDQELQYLKTKELFFEKQKVDIQTVVRTKDEFAVLYSYYHKLNLVSHIRKYNSEGVLLDSLKLPEDESGMDIGSFMPFLSKNHGMLLLVKPLTYYSMDMILIDLTKLEIIWYQEHAFESYNLERDLANIAVRDNGEVYLVFEKNNFGWQKNKHHQHIFIIFPGDKQLKDLKLPFQGKLTADFDLVFDEKNGKVVGSGLYAERSVENAAGFFSYALKDGSLEKDLIFTPFSIKLLKNNPSGKRKIKKELNDLRIGDVLVKNDGGLMMFIETRKELTRESARNRYTDYYFEDIFLICTRPDGSLFWDDQIRKYQLSYDDEAKYSSYFLFATPSSVRLVFNDEIKDENTISEYVFSPLGPGKRKSLFSTDLHRMKLMFSKALQVSSDSFLVPSLSEGKYRVVFVQY